MDDIERRILSIGWLRTRALFADAGTVAPVLVLRGDLAAATIALLDALRIERSLCVVTPLAGYSCTTSSRSKRAGSTADSVEPGASSGVGRTQVEVVIPDCGHVAFIEKPREFNAAFHAHLRS
ncbi:TPA: hypothetical protein DCY65_00575 [Candidatus Acetothermia bacterium]|nr:hypothetical protein [Candidatus Acetothermia bacterium]